VQHRVAGDRIVDREPERIALACRQDARIEPRRHCREEADDEQRRAQERALREAAAQHDEQAGERADRQQREDQPPRVVGQVRDHRLADAVGRPDQRDEQHQLAPPQRARPAQRALGERARRPEREEHGAVGAEHDQAEDADQQPVVAT
jgi:hypothetical protein